LMSFNNFWFFECMFSLFLYFIFEIIGSGRVVEKVDTLVYIHTTEY